MSLIRTRVSAQLTVTHTFIIDETLTDATGSVSYTVTRLDGTAVVSGTATHGSTGVYYFVLPPQSQLDTFKVVWSATISGGAVSATDYIEIAGDFIADIGRIRTSPPALDTNRYSTADLIAARLEAEITCEEICGQAFVPRFKRFKFDGTNTNTLMTDILDIRTIRALTVRGQVVSQSSIANITFTDSGVLNWVGGWFQAWGKGDIVIELEHGLDYPPPYISEALVVHARSLLNKTSSKIPQNTTSYTVQDGGTYRLAQPSERSTGIPMVDAAYARGSGFSGGFA